MTEKKYVPQEVIFGGETVELPEIKKRLDEFFEGHGADLSLDQIERLRDWFKQEVIRHVRREAQTKNKPKSEFAAPTLTYFLGRLEERVRIAIEEPRLCPELASKVSLKKEFIERFNTGKTVVLVNIDLDGFKSINDQFDHLAGDTLLRDVGSALGTAIRTTDIGAHYSGDEFGALLDINQPIPPKQGEKFGVLLELDGPTVNPNNVSEITAGVVSRIVTSIRKNVSRPDQAAQEMSVGVSIVEPKAGQNAMAAFEAAYAAADKASELSKIIGLIPQEGGTITPSDERVILSEDISKVEQTIDPEKLRKAKVIRHLKRALGESYGKIPPAELAKITDEFFTSLETALTNTAAQ